MQLCSELAERKATLWLRPTSNIHPVFRATAKASGHLASADFGEVQVGSAWCCEPLSFIALQGSHFVCGKLAVATARSE